MMKTVRVMVLLAWFIRLGGVYAQTIPSDRTFISAWNDSGYGGEIPFPFTIVNVRDYGAVGDGVANDRPAFSSALAALGGKPGVVFVPAGTYLFTSTLSMPSNAILRGQSPTNTTLVIHTNVLGTGINISSSQSSTYQMITTAIARQSLTLPVTNPAVFTPGGYAELRFDTNKAWGCTYWFTMGPAQIIRIAGVSSNFVTLVHPVRLDIPTNLNPRIRPISPIMHVGIENLRIERTWTGPAASPDNEFTIGFNWAARCWVRNVESFRCFGGHVGATYSTQIEVSGCYFHEGINYDGGGSAYGVRLELNTGEVRVENCIFRKLRHAMLVQAGANGNVFAYNYSREPYSTDNGENTGDISLHGNYPFANLFEGNICQHIWIDDSHKVNGPWNTFFRNRAEKNGLNMTQAQSHGQNFAGNECMRNGNWLWELMVGNGWRLQGTNHFNYANNTKASGIQPNASSTNLADVSYYLTTNPMSLPPPPPWWNIPDFLPTIGLRHHTNLDAVKTNPAKARWDAGGRKTYGPPSVARLPPPRLLVQPGQTVVLETVAYGHPAVTNAWYKNGALLEGATGAVLTLSNVGPSDAGWYQVAFSDSGGAVTSQPFQIVLFEGFLRFTNHLGALESAGNWDPPVGPPDSAQTGRVEALIEGGTMEARFLANLFPPPAELEIGTGGILRLEVPMTNDHGLILNGGALRAGSTNAAFTRPLRIRGDSLLDARDFSLAVKGTMRDHAEGTGRLMTVSTPPNAVQFFFQNSEYSGGTLIQSGEAHLYSNQAVGVGPVEVMTGAVLRISGATVIQTNAVILNGGWIRSGRGSAAFKAPVRIRSNSFMGTDGTNALAVYGPILDDPAGTGKLILSNSTETPLSLYSLGSLYTGGTEFQKGVVLLYSNDATGVGPFEVWPDAILIPAASAVSQTNPIVMRGGRITPGTSTVSLRAPVELRENSWAVSTNANHLALYGPIRDHAAGVGRLIISNSAAGTVRFYSTGSPFNGGVEVVSGIVQVYSNHSMGVGPFEILAKGTLQSAATTVQSTPIVLKGGQYYVAANYNLTAPIQVWTDSFLNASGTTSAALAGPLMDYSESRTGRLIKRGTGYLALSGGTNAFSGGIDVQEGTLACTVNGSLGNGDVTVQEGGILYINCATGSYGVSRITVLSNGVVQLNGSRTTNILIRSGGKIRGLAGGSRSVYDTLTLDGDGWIERQSGSGFLAFYGPFRDGAQPGRFVLATTNPFPVYLYATNTYTGGTILTGGSNPVGELILGVPNCLPTSGTMTVEAGAALNMNGKSAGIGSLEGQGEVRMGAVAGTRLTLWDGRATVFSGVIGGTGGIIRAGTGMLTLAGSNLWVGPLEVTGGVVRVDSRLEGGGTGAVVNVYGGGFLGGTGWISRAVVMRTGGGFDWRDSPGTLTLVTNGTWVFPSGGIFRVQGDTNRLSRVRIQGTLGLPSIARVEISSDAAAALPVGGWRFFDADAITGPETLKQWETAGAGLFTVERDDTSVWIRKRRSAGAVIVIR